MIFMYPIDFQSGRKDIPFFDTWIFFVDNLKLLLFVLADFELGQYTG